MKRFGLLTICGAVAALGLVATAQQQRAILGGEDVPPGLLPAGPARTSEDLLAKQYRAPVDTLQLNADHPRHRYQTLLKSIDMPGDRETYGDFCDYGYWAGATYGGHDQLPAGYWVYVAPTWHIYKEDQTVGTAKPPKSWGPEQAIGAPDTWPKSGDIGSAWASKTPDEQREWLELSYALPVRPVAVVIYETFNPGAVDRVSSFDADGKEVDLWTGADPTPAGKGKGISVIPLQPDFDLSRIRIGLDSQKVQGWNEIDAVGLLDEAGKIHWAAGATASSTYADRLVASPEVETLRLQTLNEQRSSETNEPRLTILRGDAR